MKYNLYFICLLLTAFTLRTSERYNRFRPGEIWKDTDGKSIQAHGGGILYNNGVYYWYGENKDSPTHKQHVPVVGVSCYSSKDLYNWKYEGVVLPAVKTDTAHDLHPSKVLERPKVIYNEKTKKFVMWMHVDTRPGYKYARAGVAVSDNPRGPFQYLNSMRPNNAMSRDITLFKDTDGKAYIFHSSEDNKTMYISRLTDDYLQPDGHFKRLFIDQLREAPAVFKHNRHYFIITSGCTGWTSNAARYAIADSVLGEWKMIDNPCRGPKSEITFNTQGTFVFPVQGKKDAYIFMADRWNPQNLSDSRYIWLPLQIRGDSLAIQWLDKWDLSYFGK